MGYEPNIQKESDEQALVIRKELLTLLDKLSKKCSEVGDKNEIATIVTEVKKHPVSELTYEKALELVTSLLLDRLKFLQQSHSPRIKYAQTIMTRWHYEAFVIPELLKSQSARRGMSN